MTSKVQLTLAVLAGAAIGATAISSLHAQGKGPAYVITEFTEITDAAGFAEVAKGLPASLAAGGGKLVARSDALVALDGAAPKRFAIFSFDSVDKAKAWYDSDAGKASASGRIKTTKSRSFIIEGMPN